MDVFRSIIYSKHLWISCALNIIMVVFINNSMALGYLLGTILTTSYNKEDEIIKPNPFHVFGCMLGMFIGLFIKYLIRVL